MMGKDECCYIPQSGTTFPLLFTKHCFPGERSSQLNRGDAPPAGLPASQDCPHWPLPGQRPPPAIGWTLGPVAQHDIPQEDLALALCDGRMTNNAVARSITAQIAKTDFVVFMMLCYLLFLWFGEINPTQF